MVSPDLTKLHRDGMVWQVLPCRSYGPYFFIAFMLQACRTYGAVVEIAQVLFARSGGFSAGH
jgi:hypothetical protein